MIPGIVAQIPLVTGGGGGAAGLSLVSGQFASHGNDFSGDLTFPNPATEGNWIIGITLYSGDASIVAATGFTTVANQNDYLAGRASSGIVYRQVQSGDGATFTPTNGMGGGQHYSAMWELEPSDPGAEWADLFGAAQCTIAMYGAAVQSNYTLDNGEPYLVLAGASARGSGSGTSISSPWTTRNNEDNGGLNRRWSFADMVVADGDPIDMSGYVPNPWDVAGMASIALRSV